MNLVERWHTSDGERLAEEVVARLLAGRALGGLGLGQIEGRVDLRGLPAPVPGRLERFESDAWFVEELGELLEFQGCHLADLDLSGAFLDSLRWTRCTISNCRFDGARCQDWRMWATTVDGSSFDGADLRRSALDPWLEGRGNLFRGVSFRRADLRQVTSTTATYVDGDFSEAKLVKLDFQSSGFTRCRFAGVLRNVTFWDHGHDTGKPDPNPMDDVDFTDAHFREVELRRLSLERVLLPKSAEHLVIHRYRCVLDRALAELEHDPRRDAQALRIPRGVRALGSAGAVRLDPEPRRFRGTG